MNRPTRVSLGNAWRSSVRWQLFFRHHVRQSSEDGLVDLRESLFERLIANRYSNLQKWCADRVQPRKALASNGHAAGQSHQWHQVRKYVRDAQAVPGKS